MGGMWVAPQQSHMQTLLQELSIPTYKQYGDGNNIHDDGYSLSTYQGTIPRVSWLTLLDTHFLLGALDKLSKSLTVGEAQDSSSAKDWDSTSVYDYAIKKCWTAQAMRLLGIACRTVLGAEPEQISLLYFTNYCASAGGVQPLLDTENGGQDSRIVGGTNRLLTTLIDKIQKKETPTKIYYDSKVSSVEWDVRRTGYATIQCSNHVVYYAKRIIMCCPPSCLNNINFSPTVSPWKKSLWARSHAGCFTKIVVIYKTAFWRNNGFSGSAVCEQVDSTKPISGVFDYCDGDGGNPALCCFVVGDSGVEFAALSEAEQRDAVISQLVYMFGPEAAQEHVVEYLCMDWLHNPENEGYGGGCPADIIAMGFFREQASHLSRPLSCGSQGIRKDGAKTGVKDTSNTINPLVESLINNDDHYEAHGPDVVFFAGTETALSWIGYMEGAVDSGFRAAELVLISLKSSKKNHPFNKNKEGIMTTPGSLERVNSITTSL